jgi:cobalt-zinc-cadmium efflux system membrane fusion protein
MKHKYIGILSLVLFTFLFIACKSREKSEKASEHEVLPPNVIEFSTEQYQTAGIVMDSLQMEKIGKTITVTGIITVPPQSYATVCATYGGYIKSSLLMEGSYVQKGHALALIENPDFVDLQQNYLETKSKLDYAENEYKRQKELNSNNVNSTKIVQQAEMEFKTLKACLNALIQKLAILGIDPMRLSEDNIKSSIPLISPISGYIKKVNVNIGRSITPTDVLFEIVNTGKLTLELNVFEKDLMQLNIGQTLTFSIPNDDQKTYNATILQTGKTLDNDKTAKVYASIDLPEKNLIAGMYVNAKIDVLNSESVCLPSEAVVQFDEKCYVFALKEKGMENGKEITLFEAIEIKIGKENNGLTEIFFNNESEYRNRMFVIKGAYSILSKFKNSGEMSC